MHVDSRSGQHSDLAIVHLWRPNTHMNAFVLVCRLFSHPCGKS
jgi:hypothetical protein